MVLRTGIDSPVRAAWFTMASLSSTMPSSGIGSMDDIQDLFKETIAGFMENGLEAELDEDLGYSKYRFGFEDDLDHTLKETAKHFHLSVSRAKSTEKSALTNFE